MEDENNHNAEVDLDSDASFDDEHFDIYDPYVAQNIQIQEIMEQFESASDGETSDESSDSSDEYEDISDIDEENDLEARFLQIIRNQGFTGVYSDMVNQSVGFQESKFKEVVYFSETKQRANILDGSNEHILSFTEEEKETSSTSITERLINVFKSKAGETNTNASTQLPMPMSGHRVVSDGNFIYVIGGYDNNLLEKGVFGCENSNTLSVKDGLRASHQYHHHYLGIRRFCLETQTWMEMDLNGLKIKAASCHACIINTGDPIKYHENFLVISGGANYPWDNDVSNQLHILLIKKSSNIAKLIKSVNLSTSIYGHSLAYVPEEKSIYQFGGIDKRNFDMFTSYFDKIDLQSGKVTKVNESIEWLSGPPERMKGELFYHKGKLFLFGGHNNTESFKITEPWVFNLKKKSWSKLEYNGDQEDFPRFATLFGASKYHNFIYFTGGKSNGYPNVRSGNTCWKYDLDANSWSFVTHLKTALNFHDSCIADGKLYVFGGKVRESAEKPSRTNKMYSLDIKVQSLQNICKSTILAA